MDPMVLHKVLSLGADFVNDTFYQNDFYYKTKQLPLTETHLCYLSTQSEKCTDIFKTLTTENNVRTELA